jgi:hypothetical protein
MFFFGACRQADAVSLREGVQVEEKEFEVYLP